MTQQYLAGELSLLLGQLQAAITTEASAAELAQLRQRAEAGPRPELTAATVRALEVGDRVCWHSLTRGDVAAFVHQAVLCAHLWEFGVCSALIEER